MAQNVSVEDVVRAMISHIDIKPKTSTNTELEEVVITQPRVTPRGLPPPGYPPMSTPMPGHHFSFNPQVSGFHPSMFAAQSPSLPKIPSFSGDIPTPKGEVQYMVWQYEVQCLIRVGDLSEVNILTVIRASQRGRAREIIAPLGERASLSVVMDKLDAVFSNASSKEDLLQQFFNSTQQPGESITTFACRLEIHLQIIMDKGDIPYAARNDILRHKV
ncbi:uncharacterized protein LOC128241268 [Mya arenaria]|uniref:uncharacterized protein LOC128241268 n=1 Tax=Mya arenaria TaxID=6604 RepID=UPI0022E22FD0|nr:uncharacterized protein LOC128241268 [Mya arenaria]